ncbi:MAG: hypothetical protein BGO58_00155 [Sphingopyxis sp. 65-8]|nr:hypothetical protein [Sphingopyxis terrae]OJW29300.1 MAG: hypothetical protein BGO58_00155 [Sphingopyxis sp. 65-8]
MIRWSPTAPARAACPHRRIARLLTRLLPPGAQLGASTMRPWASANFVGARHLFPLTLPAGTALTDLSAQLAAFNWRLAGHIVADVAVEPQPGGLQVEILSVED